MLKHPSNSIFTLLILFFIGLTHSTQAQDYFQQEVNYRIEVELLPDTKSLSGFIEIDYLNQSPDTLAELYFHLWPNAFKNEHTAFAKQQVEQKSLNFQFSKEADRGYIDSLLFKANGENLAWTYHPKHIDIALLELATPLAPGDRVSITTPFYVKIPKTFSRLGASQDEDAYQITQWYPKPAVYDSEGWHPMPYLSLGEFYSEFGTFDVSIKVPSNYVVAAAGNLLNEKEAAWLDAMANWNGPEELPKNPSLNPRKTLRYVLENSHDFAWFANPDFMVKKGTVELPNGERTIESWAFYLPKNEKAWKDALAYIHDGVYYQSLWNFPYPYEQCIAVDGDLTAGGGMEYPGITIISSFSDDLRSIFFHEIGHNWFYGMAGFNERRYPYLDEGLTTFNQVRYENEILKRKIAVNADDFNIQPILNFFDIQDYRVNDLYATAWRYIDRTENRQAANTHSEQFNSMNYSLIAYYKMAFAWEFLKEYIGDETFDRGMHEFFEAWAFKHPQPHHLQASLEASWNQPLDWFFVDLLQKESHIDYKPVMMFGNEVQVSNYGSVTAPFYLVGLNEKDTIVSRWEPGHLGNRGIEMPEEVSEIIINPGLTGMDLFPQNNRLVVDSWLGRREVRLRPIGGLEVPHKKHLYLSPIIGVNGRNGLMTGFGFSNHFLMKRKTEFEFYPVYGFESRSIGGKAALRFHPHHRWNLGLEGKRFATLHDHYERLRAYVEYQHPIHLPTRNYLDFRLEMNSVDWNLFTLYFDLRFMLTHRYETALSKVNTQFQVIFNPDYQRVQIESSYERLLNSWKDKLSVRFFAGANAFPAFVSANNFDQLIAPYDLSLTGSLPYTDYRADHYFFARESVYFPSNSILYTNNPVPIPVNNFWNQQFAETEGGFFGNYGFIPANRALASLGLKYHSGLLKVVNLFANVGLNQFDYNQYAMPPQWSGNLKNNKLNYFYEGGIELALIPDFLSIYYPMVASDNLVQIQEASGINGWEKVRFQLRFDQIDPLVWLRKAHRYF